jgi:hypothetical protein
MTDFTTDEMIHVWGYSAPEIEALKRLHEEKGFPPPRPIFEEQLGLTIAEILAGGTGATPKKQPPVRVLLLPKKSTDAGIKAYLAAFRESGLPRPIFAAVTDTSEAWTFTYLVEHLMEEQAEVMKQMKAKAEQDGEKW